MFISFECIVSLNNVNFAASRVISEQSIDTERLDSFRLYDPYNHSSSVSFTIDISIVKIEDSIFAPARVNRFIFDAYRDYSR